MLSNYPTGVNMDRILGEDPEFTEEDKWEDRYDEDPIDEAPEDNDEEHD